jgi:hypothetical protein
VTSASTCGASVVQSNVSPVPSSSVLSATAPAAVADVSFVLTVRLFNLLLTDVPACDLVLRTDFDPITCPRHRPCSSAILVRHLPDHQILVRGFELHQDEESQPIYCMDHETNRRVEVADAAKGSPYTLYRVPERWSVSAAKAGRLLEEEHRYLLQHLNWQECYVCWHTSRQSAAQRGPKISCARCPRSFHRASKCLGTVPLPSKEMELSGWACMFCRQHQPMPAVDEDDHMQESPEIVTHSSSSSYHISTYSETDHPLGIRSQTLNSLAHVKQSQHASTVDGSLLAASTLEPGLPSNLASASPTQSYASLPADRNPSPTEPVVPAGERQQSSKSSVVLSASTDGAYALPLPCADSPPFPSHADEDEPMQEIGTAPASRSSCDRLSTVALQKLYSTIQRSVLAAESPADIRGWLRDTDFNNCFGSDFLNVQGQSST